MRTFLAPVPSEKFTDLIERLSTEKIICINRMPGFQDREDFWINIKVSQSVFDELVKELSANRITEIWDPPYQNNVLYIEELLEDVCGPYHFAVSNRIVIYARI